ncbi:thioredoxin family protein [PVC group bacterium]|nr:thioredoxin family protein [PVC group bacterium]
MKARTLVVLSLALVLLLFGTKLLVAEPLVAEKAPDFTLTDTNGVSHTLSDYQGRYVVLEWVNYDCPFVRKHYKSGNMQDLQKEYTQREVIWLSICSSAEGKQGQFSNEEIKNRMDEFDASPTHYLNDLDGSVGRLYQAKTTPHMFIINPEGILVYQGAIDNHPFFWEKGLFDATNYIREALDYAMNGQSVAVTNTKSYGCSVKYK